MPPRSTYTEEIADEILDRITNGESMRTICRSDHMPDPATVYRWLNNNPDFAERYKLAREAQADTLFDEILEIADDARNDWMERGGKDDIGWQLNGENIQRTRARIDARKWMAGKLRPKKYSDKLEISGEGGGPVAFVLRDMTKTDD